MLDKRQGMPTGGSTGRPLVMVRNETRVVAKEDTSFLDLVGLSVAQYQKVKGRYAAIRGKRRELEQKRDTAEENHRGVFEFELELFEANIIQEEGDRLKAAEPWSNSSFQSCSNVTRPADSTKTADVADNAADRWDYSLSKDLKAEIPIETLAYLQRRFREADSDNNGTIDAREFYQMCADEFGRGGGGEEGGASSDADFQKWDENRSGSLDFEEFAKCMLPKVYADHRYWDKEAVAAKEESAYEEAEKTRLKLPPPQAQAKTRSGYLVDEAVKEQMPESVLNVMDAKFADVDTVSDCIVPVRLYPDTLYLSIA
jgi:hypothetical protein